MSQQELLKRVIQSLNGVGAPYMLTGSIASSLQGEPRSTHDVDIVVSLDARSAKALIAAFPAPEYYVSDAAALEAVATASAGGEAMFNLIDLQTGDKVDFWLLTHDAFDQSRFARRREEDAGGWPIVVSTPEDTILMKLKWAALSGGSEKQFNDALRVYEVQQGRLDEAYLDEWASRLGLSPSLAALRRRAEPE